MVRFTCVNISSLVGRSIEHTLASTRLLIPMHVTHTIPYLYKQLSS